MEVRKLIPEIDTEQSIPRITKIYLPSEFEKSELQEVISVFRKCANEISKTKWHEKVSKDAVVRATDTVHITVFNLNSMATLMEKALEGSEDSDKS